MEKIEEVYVLSETKQMFNGVIYYKCGARLRANRQINTTNS